MLSPAFSIELTGGLTWARLAVSGELDIAVADQFREALDRERAAGRPVVVDLSQVTFMDSSGLTVLLRAIDHAKSNGWRFGVADSLSEQVELVARVSGVLALLPLVEE